MCFVSICISINRWLFGKEKHWFVLSLIVTCTRFNVNNYSNPDFVSSSYFLISKLKTMKKLMQIKISSIQYTHSIIDKQQLPKKNIPFRADLIQQNSNKHPSFFHTHAYANHPPHRSIPPNNNNHPPTPQRRPSAPCTRRARGVIGD